MKMDRESPLLHELRNISGRLEEIETELRRAVPEHGADHWGRGTAAISVVSCALCVLLVCLGAPPPVAAPAAAVAWGILGLVFLRTVGAAVQMHHTYLADVRRTLETVERILDRHSPKG